MNRKKALAVLMAAAMTSSIFGAVPAMASEDKPFEGQEITFADTGGGSWDEKLEPIIAKFEEETGAKVNMELYAHSDYLEMLQVKLPSESDDYDVIGVDVPLVASYATKGWIAPMDSYFTDDEKAQFASSALDAGTWDGVFYCPAMNSSSQLLWYNTELLGEAGVEVPESSVENRLTWEQVVDMAKKTLEVVDPDGTKGIGGIAFEQVSRTYQMNQIPNSLGGKNIGDDGYTAQGIINDDAWIEGATWYQNLFKDGIALQGFTADDTGSFFQAGKIVFLIGGTWTDTNCKNEEMDTPLFRRLKATKIRWAPLPAAGILESR